MAYRAEFGHDFVIDLVGYRRFGHNEQDEASYTQPLMVERIETQPTARERTRSDSSTRACSPRDDGGRAGAGRHRRRCARPTSD